MRWAQAIVAAIEAEAIEVIRGDENRLKMVQLNRSEPETLDDRFAALKVSLE
jgi:uncharacterized protein YggU (UPF0235/DUF167 family)